jgi:aminoglycoside phosphotransferase (APT) family kinase protein
MTTAALEHGRVAVGEVLSRAYERPISVGALRTESSPFATLFPVDVLHVSLDGGEELSLWVKQLGDEQSDHPDKHCREREIRIYEELFAGRDLPVPRFYGWRFNERTGRRDLYLEHVDDWNLKYQDLSHWYRSAERLADLHASFAGRADELADRDFLLRFDAAYFEEWAGRAVEAVGHRIPELAEAMGVLVARFDRAIEVLAGQPSTLVHNDLAPKNVLADRSCDPARICIVDWEMAGIGCGLMDLVHLKYGFAYESNPGRRLCDAYCSRLAGTGLLPGGARELRRLFAACEVQKAVNRLAYRKQWNIPVETVAAWIDEGARFAAEL